MSEHLDPRTLDRYIAGEYTPESESHLRECAACRERASQMEAVLARFAAGTRLWSESHAASRQPAIWSAPAVARRHRIAPVRWAGVAAALAILAAVPLYRGYEQRQEVARAKADALLLEEVSTDLSRPAPQPLEPLIDLVSQSTANGESQ